MNSIALDNIAEWMGLIKHNSPEMFIKTNNATLQENYNDNLAHIKKYACPTNNYQGDYWVQLNGDMYASCIIVHFTDNSLINYLTQVNMPIPNMIIQSPIDNTGDLLFTLNQKYTAERQIAWIRSIQVCLTQLYNGDSTNISWQVCRNPVLTGYYRVSNLHNCRYQLNYISKTLKTFGKYPDMNTFLPQNKMTFPPFAHPQQSQQVEAVTADTPPPTHTPPPPPAPRPAEPMAQSKPAKAPYIPARSRVNNEEVTDEFEDNPYGITYNEAECERIITSAIKLMTMRGIHIGITDVCKQVKGRVKKPQVNAYFKQNEEHIDTMRAKSKENRESTPTKPLHKQISDKCDEVLSKDKKQEDTKAQNKPKDNHFKGKKHTQESKDKISRTKRESGCHKGERNGMYGRTGSKHPFYGRKHTEETKTRMRKTRMKSKINKEKDKKRTYNDIYG